MVEHQRTTLKDPCRFKMVYIFSLTRSGYPYYLSAMPTNTPSIEQLKRALAISEQIEKLQAEFASVLGGAAPASVAKAAAPAKKKGGLTPEGRAKLAASMKARWAARRKGAPAPTKAAASSPKPAAKAKVKRTISPEARARMVAGAKKRWANKK